MPWVQKSTDRWHLGFLKLSAEFHWCHQVSGFLFGMVWGFFLFLCCQSLSFLSFRWNGYAKALFTVSSLEGLFFRCVHLNDDREKKARDSYRDIKKEKTTVQPVLREVTPGSKWINQQIKLQWVMELSKLFLQYLKSIVETVGIAGCSLENWSLFQKCFCKVVFHCPVIWPPQMSHLRGLCFLSESQSCLVQMGPSTMLTQLRGTPSSPKRVSFPAPSNDMRWYRITWLLQKLILFCSEPGQESKCKYCKVFPSLHVRMDSCTVVPMPLLDCRMWRNQSTVHQKRAGGSYWSPWWYFFWLTYTGFLVLTELLEAEPGLK